MVRSRPIHACIVTLAMLLAAGCGERKVTQPEPVGLRLTPLPDEEAECMALWLSGEIEAPMDLYERIRSDLKKIRESSLNVAHFESLTFIAPWVPSMIIMRVDSADHARLENHESPLWDSLNALYHAEIGEPDEDGHTYFPHFPGRLNPDRLAEAYAQVPGVRWTQPNHVWSFVGWYRYVYPGRLEGDTLTYVFQRGDGFPDQWIGGNSFWCFYSTPMKIAYVGVYNQLNNVTGPAPPDWWADFCSSVRRMNPYAKEWCHGNPGVIPVRIVDQPAANFRKDAFVLESLSLTGDILSLTVRYGGGCYEHNLLLFMSPSAFAESMPVQANLYLFHDARGDQCEALITETVRFDISPIAHQYERFYGGPGDIRLNVYNFEQTESQQVLYRHR